MSCPRCGAPLLRWGFDPEPSCPACGYVEYGEEELALAREDARLVGAHHGARDPQSLRRRTAEEVRLGRRANEKRYRARRKERA